MNKKIFILFFIFIFTGITTLFSQISVATVTNNTVISNNKTTNEIAVPLETQINNKLLEAKDYLRKANESYEAGYYTKGYEYAQKAKAAAAEAENLKIVLSKKLSAKNKINQAKTLIQEAEDKEADKYAPDELANAKTSLLSAQDFFDKESWDSSLEKANESIAYAETCLSKIEENRKKLEETKTPKIVESPPTSTTKKPEYTGDYKIKTTYKVRLIPERRDCLWRISKYKNIYNNPLKWPIIYKANKDKIKDPDLIYPGQIFQIPELDKDGNPIMMENITKKTTNVIKVNSSDEKKKDNNTKLSNSEPKFDSSDQQTPANANESKANTKGD